MANVFEEYARNQNPTGYSYEQMNGMPVDTKGTGGYLDHLRPKDAWDRLPMDKKAEMMGVAVSNGITDLPTIRKKYNEFAEGGDTKQPVTTGGAGYVPSIPDMDIKQRLYDNIIPFGYKHPAERLASAILLNKPSKYEEMPQHGNYDALDELWATYLDIPADKRHYDPVLRKSNYRPSIEKDGNTTYYALPLHNDEKDYMIDAALNGQKGARSPELGKYSLGTGYDSKGHYVSYYDKWDLNPFRGVTNIGNSVTNSLGLNKLGDVSMGIGKPVEVYDRIYLDDYYGVPEPTHSTYLPEIVVNGYSNESSYLRKDGGSIHIKPENRGKFTALKERTGHSASWFKEHGTPAQKRMAIFELNARHWKHGDGGPLQGPIVNMAMANMYAGGGSTADDDLVDFLIREEGFTSKPTDIGDGKLTLGSGLTAQKWRDLYQKRGNKWSAADNRMAVREEVANRRRWAERNIPNWDSLPSSSQKALLAYKYNYDFNAVNSPRLFQALKDSNLYEAARQMDATSKDPKFQKGLAARRKREQAWFLSDVGMPDITPSVAPITAPPVSTAVYNPYPIKMQNTTVAPRMVPDEGSYVRAHQLTESEIRRQELQERWDAINCFNNMMRMLDIQNNPMEQFTSTNPMFEGIEGLMNAEGGKIRIKPENRGKLTELKKRTGKTEAELYNDGNPAHKKMVVFARNSRKWHGDGGYLQGPLVDMALGNVYDGFTSPTNQMQIGRGYWQSVANEPTAIEAAAIYNKEKQQQAAALRRQIAEKGKAIADGRVMEGQVASNDNAWVQQSYTRPKNRHLERKAVEGAKAHAAWEQEHPNLTAWGNVLGAVPFAVAAAPLGAGIGVVGDAAAATTAGQAVTSVLAPLYQAATGATIAGAPVLAGVNAGLQSAVAAHGLSETFNGNFTPMTALELLPLAPGVVRAPGIVSNLRPQRMREHWYVAKPPIGYDGIGAAADRWVRGVASGRRADVDNPWWFNSSSAKSLQDYAYVPDAVQGVEREEYLRQFGEHALEARADAWRMHNLMPQKFGTFTPNPRHPGSYTDLEGIRRLKYLPLQVEGQAQTDFVNSVGGNIGVPELTSLGTGFPNKGSQVTQYGVSTTSDWFDLHPFSRETDKLRPKFIKPLWTRLVSIPALNDAKWLRNVAGKFKYDNASISDYLAQNKDNEWAMEMFDPDMFPATGLRRKAGDAIEAVSNKFSRIATVPEFKFLKPLEDKMAKLEAGDITGGRPFLVRYDIPYTTNIRYTSEAPGVVSEQLPGFVADQLLPQGVFNWRQGVSTELADIENRINYDKLLNSAILKSKR